ncbi:MAG: porin family protein [Prolixibacteraceae bacterium]
MIRLTVLLLLTLISSATIAQNFRLGFQASPQMSWMTSSKSGITNNELRPGVKYGLEADIFLSGFPRYSLNTGLFVVSSSYSAHYDIEETFFINEVTFENPVDLNFKMNYIEIPLDIKLKSDQFYRMNFYGQFGLAALFNLSASASSSDAKFGGDDVNSEINNYTIKPFNLCMIMGAGVEYDVGGNTALNLGLQYSNGLIDITNIGNLSEKTNLNSLRLVLGVMF